MRKFLSTRLIAAFLLLTQACVPFSAIANGLTPGSQTITGSAIGQIAAANPAGVNLLSNTSAPSSLGWSAGGGATITSTVANQWDGGFVPATMAGAGPSFTLDQAITIAPGATSSYTFSAQFSISRSLTGITTPSTQVALSASYTNGVTRTDTVVVNPASGQLISSTSGVSAVQVQLFNTIIVNATTGANTTIPVVSVAFTSRGITAATTAVDLIVRPQNIVGSTSQVAVGALQFELGPVFTAFMPTGYSPVAPIAPAAARLVGQIPPQTVNRGLSTLIYSLTHVFDPITDGSNIVRMDAASRTFTLTPTIASMLKDGATVTLLNNNTGQTTIDAGTAKIMGPGIASAGVATLAFPPTSGTQYPKASITLTYDAGATAWHVTGGNLITSGGTGCLTTGSATQALSDNGAGGCASNSNVTIASTGLTVTGGASNASVLTVGTGSTTSQGWVAGNLASGTSGLWASNVTPGATNYTLDATATAATLNASTTVTLDVANSAVVTVAATGQTVTGTATATGVTNAPTFTSTLQSPTIAANVLTINMAAGDWFEVNNTANITTFTVSNPPASGTVGRFTLCLKANGSGFTQVYPGSTVWPGGAAPTLTTTNNYRDCLGFATTDGGTTYTAFVLGQAIR